MVPAAVREAFSSGYEDLRRVALAGADPNGLGRGVGFALFIRSGMARWMDCCGDLLVPQVPAPPRRRVEERQQLDPDLRIEVAMVFAQMALSAHSQGVTTC